MENTKISYLNSVLNVKILINKLKELGKNLNEEQINLISSHIEVYNRNN